MIPFTVLLESPKGKSNRTRIETTDPFKRKLVPRLAPKGKSNRTRIETNEQGDIVFPKPLVLRKENPIEQGLKQACQALISAGKRSPSRKENPIEQGLKLVRRHDGSNGRPAPKGKSNRTRIETQSRFAIRSRSTSKGKSNRTRIETNLGRKIGHAG